MSLTITQLTPREDEAATPRHSYLSLALRADRPRSAPVRIALGALGDGAADWQRGAIDEVRVGRGAATGAAMIEPGICALTLDDASLSSQHFRLCRDGAGWRLEDAGSRNGTLIRGERVAQVALADGAVVEAGHAFFVLRTCDVAAGARLLRTDEVAAPRGLVTLRADLADHLAQLARVTASALPILIRGETGTGKELVARAIHELSGRAGALIAVNCASIPHELLHAELFGARRGAYSGATADRPGLVRAADRGTLFFDEIAELPPSAQVTLLRLLQEHEVVPLGATEPTPVDVRFIAATHADVHALGFRPDLLGRITGFVATLPPLRERREDLGLLLARFLDECDAPAALELSLPAARRAMHAAWRLNIRQLRHTAIAAALSGEQRLAAARFPEDELGASKRDEAAPDAASDERRGTVTADALADLLRAHAGNVSAVARALATSRTQITRLMRRYKLDPSGNATE